MFCVYCGAKDAAKFCVACGRAQAVTPSAATVATARKPDLPPTLLPDKSQSCESRVQSMCDRAVELASELTDLRIDAAHDSLAVAPPPLPTQWQASSEQAGDWVHSLDYETVLHAAVPRERIARAARRVKAGLGGEDLLKLFDKVSPIPIPMAKINNAVLPIYEKLGIKTTQQFNTQLHAPVGHVMLALLCVFAERSFGITDVRQTDRQCTLVADLPLGFITNRGRLIATLNQQATGVIELSLATEILGQVWDWGRSKRLSDDLHTAITAELQSIDASPVYGAKVA